MEVSTVIAEAKAALSELDEWMQPTTVSGEANKFRRACLQHAVRCMQVATPLGALPGASAVHYQPKGVVVRCFHEVQVAIAARHCAVYHLALELPVSADFQPPGCGRGGR